MQKKITIIGAPCDLGANIRGTILGPDAIRSQNLHDFLTHLGHATSDYGNVKVPQRSTIQNDTPNFLQSIATVTHEIKTACLASLQANQFPLLLGGDHSMAIGSVAASHEYFEDLGLIWIDTHADINTPDSSPSKNIHGMPVSVLLKEGYHGLTKLVHLGMKPENIVMIGLRDIDQTEKVLLRQSGVQFFTLRDVDELGIQGVFKRINKEFIATKTNLHVSFDLDVMDPLQVPGVSTPVNGGLTIREAHLLLELLHETGKVRSCDFVELNPLKDIKGTSTTVAVELIGSLLGSTII